MRVSTSFLTKISLDAMLDQQVELSKTQIQVTTGKRLTAPSDDPFGSSRSLDLDESIKLNNQYQENAGYAENRLVLEEGTLEGVGNAAQRVRELMVLGNNDSQNNETRKFIREEVVQLLDQILELANSVDSNGEYIFSGFQGKTKPFASDGAGGFNYFGDDGQRFLSMSASTSIPMGDSGEETFLTVKNGNGTFQTSEGYTTLGVYTDIKGNGIIDPGTVFGTYVPDIYQIKFVPPSSGDMRDPIEYYVLDGQGLVVVPAANAGATDAAYVAGVEARVNTGIPYEEGAVIQGLDALGIKTTISGEPVIETTPAITLTSPLPPPAVYTINHQDGFTVEPSQYQSIFDTVQNFIDTLVSPQTGTADQAKFHNAMNRNIVDLDQSVGRILEIRSRVGARLNTVDKQLEINESFSLQMNQTLSSIQDLDYSEAITRLNLQLTGLQAAQNAYTKIQGLSLFNFL